MVWDPATFASPSARSSASEMHESERLLMEISSPSSSDLKTCLRMFFRRSPVGLMYFSRPRVQYFFPFLIPRPFSSTLFTILLVFSLNPSKSSLWNQRSSGESARSLAAGTSMTRACSLKEQLLTEEVVDTVEKESDNDDVEAQDSLLSIPEKRRSIPEALLSVGVCIEIDNPVKAPESRLSFFVDNDDLRSLYWFAGKDIEADNDDLLSLFGLDGKELEADNDDRLSLFGRIAPNPKVEVVPEQEVLLSDVDNDGIGYDNDGSALEQEDLLSFLRETRRGLLVAFEASTEGCMILILILS